MILTTEFFPNCFVSLFRGTQYSIYLAQSHTTVFSRCTARHQRSSRNGCWVWNLHLYSEMGITNNSEHDAGLRREPDWLAANPIPYIRIGRHGQSDALLLPTHKVSPTGLGDIVDGIKHIQEMSCCWNCIAVLNMQGQSQWWSEFFMVLSRYLRNH